MKNLEKYKNDLKRLLETGDDLRFCMGWECKQERYEKALKENPEIREEVRKALEKLPPFAEGYQAWYSEAKTLIRQLLPDRLDDFVGYYEKPKGRKDVDYENYHISDYLLGLTVTRGRLGAEVVVGPSAAIPRFQQQLAIVKAVKRRFESSLFDIRQIVQADLFDSELESAQTLVKHGFLRPAGVLAGVVMEKHLAQVCENHSLKTRKKAPTIGDYNDMLKKAGVIDVPQWRFNQRLGDIRNLCGHKRDAEPTRDQVNDLVDGAMKVTKTLF